ncbi:unnamed protein product [Allacma fusca]|uniref:Biopterin-dependent aromatic amino acid hydroxylase family profile domain-containing protein n=1 Tax=Allacma fusca TaxID=39272 RepID=A0A8J2KMX0_9HEXA|nr:unnamed protein product [Allacma fusca]
MEIYSQNESDSDCSSGSNGYPSRRRSLVGDARFETQVNKEAKRTWLEEIRQLSRDSDLSEDDLLLVDDSILPAVQIPKPKDDEKPEETDLVLSLNESMVSLARILKTMDNSRASVIHLESRVSRDRHCQFDILLKINVTRSNLVSLVKSLRQSKSITSVNVISHQGSIKIPWFPRHISELDMCNHLMTKFEPDLDMDHPGFADKVYRARRKMIADIAFEYRYGQVIPRVQYTEEEVRTWGHVYNQLCALLSSHACKQYIDAFRLLEENVGYRANNIPQMEDISKFLHRRTGFTLRPAAGLLTSRDFLASLAYRVFQCTQYVRHGSAPDHSPEPDCVHELLGHVPMLVDPLFAQFSQELGLASLGATDEEIEQFSTLYWFTVEFGLCKEDGIVKAYGAGLLSSYGELQHALSDKPEHRKFDPKVTAIQPYQDQDYQDVYFVAESFNEVKDKFREWVAESMSRPYELRYDPFTQTIQNFDSVDKLSSSLTQMKIELSYLNNAVNNMSYR